MTCLRRLLRDRRGVVAIEFAIVLPVLILLTMGTLEMGLMMMVDASLEIGIRAASRAGIITASATETQRKEKIRNTIATIMDPWITSEDTIELKTSVYDNIADIGKPTWIDGNGNGVCDEGEGTCDAQGGVQQIPGAGAAGSLVLYEVTVQRPGFTGILKLMGISTLTFARQTVVLNE